MSDEEYRIEFTSTGDGMETTGWLDPSDFPWLAHAFSNVGHDARLTVETPDGMTQVYTLQHSHTTFHPVHHWR